MSPPLLWRLVSAKRALGGLMKVAAAGADTLRPPPPGIVVLIYHRVGGGSPLEIDLPASRFEAQMAILAEEYRVVSLDDALAALDGPAPEGQRPLVAVTFDDGTTDFVDVALPILERHRIHATIYVATSFVEEQTSFPNAGTPVSWSGLADACATGLVDVGSHTHRHRLLDRLAVSEVDEELDRSIGLIGDRLGRAVRHFAYPKALAGSAAADRAVRSRFRSAALAGTRANRYGATDPYRLFRSPVQRSDGLAWFARKAGGGMALEDRVRRVVNRRRYALSTT